jgi:integrase/recombinase XerD
MTALPTSDQAAVTSDELVLRAAVAAYLDRYREQSRLHTGSDLNIFLTWCAGQELDPLRAKQVDVERYARWLQDVRCYQPSTVSCRLPFVVGIYPVCADVPEMASSVG